MDLGICKALRTLNWINVVTLVIVIGLTIVFVLQLFGSIASIADMNNSEEIQTLIESNPEELGGVVGIALLLGLVMLVSYGLSIAGLVMSIILLIKISKLEINKTGTIVSIIGYLVYLVVGLYFYGIASLVLWIIGAVMLNKIIPSEKSDNKDIYVN